MRGHQALHAINRGMGQPARGEGFVRQPRHLPKAAQCRQAGGQVMLRFRQFQETEGPGQPLRRPCSARRRQIRRAQPGHGGEAHLHRQRHGPFRMRLHGPRYLPEQKPRARRCCRQIKPTQPRHRAISAKHPRRCRAEKAHRAACRRANRAGQIKPKNHRRHEARARDRLALAALLFGLSPGGGEGWRHGMHHGGFMDGVKLQRVRLKRVYESGLRGRQQSAIAPKPGFFPRAPAACCRQQTGARRMCHAGHANSEPIQQEDSCRVPHGVRNGGLRRFQKVAEQDGFSGFCHGAHAARAVAPVKHHGARGGFVLR